MNLKEKGLNRLFELLSDNDLSRFVGRVSDKKLPPPLNRMLFTLYSKIFGVDLSEIEKSLDQYETFNHFFTRRLKEEAREIDNREEVLISPSDGTIQEFGMMEKGRLLQVKEMSYSVDDLLMDVEESTKFHNGCFVTIYLSPRNYHRVHYPCKGKILGFRYIQGKLYSVTPEAVTVVENIFIRNERVVTYLATERGMVGIVMVGAMTVGRITLSYDSLVTNSGFLSRKEVYKEPKWVEKADEIGAFNLGSTVIVLTERRGFTFAHNIKTGSEVKMGQPLLHIKS